MNLLTVAWGCSVGMAALYAPRMSEGFAKHPPAISVHVQDPYPRPCRHVSAALGDRLGYRQRQCQRRRRDPSSERHLNMSHPDAKIESCRATTSSATSTVVPPRW